MYFSAHVLRLLSLGGICGSKEVGEGGTQGGGHILRKVVRVGLAADGFRPTPDPVVLALSLHRPRQHQIRGAAVPDLVPRAEARPCPHCTHRNARVWAVAGAVITHSRLPIPHAIGATLPHGRAPQREAVLTLEGQVAAHRMGPQPRGVHAVLKGNRGWTANRFADWLC